MNVFVVKLILLQGSLDTGEQFHIPGAISAPWASFGLEVVSWLLLAIFHAARAAYIVVNWMLLGCAGGGVDTTELLKGGGSGYYGAAGRRCSTVLVLDASSAGRSSRSSVEILPAGACLP